MNNIEFSFVSNQSRTKFKIAWTISLGEYPITKVMTREFPSEEAAQAYVDKNKELLVQQIRGKVSKMVISAKEPEVTEEVVDELAADLPENEIEIEKTEEDEVEIEEVTETIESTTEETEEVVDELAAELPENEIEIEKSEEDEVEIEGNTVETEEENEDVEEQSTALVPIDERALVPVERDGVVARTPNRKVKIAIRTIAGALATIIIAIGITHVIKHSKDDELPSDEPGIENPSDTNTPDTNVPDTNIPDTNIPDTNVPDTNEPGEEIVEGLTNEAFENLVAELAKTYQDENVNLTTEDVTKFVAILNIDNLVAENPELASELFKDSTKEEFIQDAAKTISETVMHNAKVFEEEKSTENFIRISDALYGEQKEQLVAIETYVDEIAKVYYDQEQVNEIATELITRLVTGDLNTLDNGVQFGMQISIELIRSYIAKNVLSDINQDVLTDITRLNVAGIMQMYDNANGLSGNAKTLN